METTAPWSYQHWCSDGCNVDASFGCSESKVIRILIKWPAGSAAQQQLQMRRGQQLQQPGMDAAASWA